MPTKTEAIGRFLKHITVPDLAALYSPDMEVQVNVGQDGGERITGEFHGRKWSGWTDGITTWKAFRIPWKANSEPEYVDSDLKWDMTVHAEGIGMTGWDWKNKVSKWVAFDFDSIVGHSKGLDTGELDEVRKLACAVPWVTVRRSTSGTGLHLYVMLDNVPTDNHNEHAALARSILGKMASVTGADLAAKVDVCGGNMWVWHRKKEGTDGLTLIKQGLILDSIPLNWRDHLTVVKGGKHRAKPSLVGLQEEREVDEFEELCGQHLQVQIDVEHKGLMSWFDDHECLWWWDADRHMMVCHTADLKRAMPDLEIRGCFETRAVGKEHGQDQNCFAYPLKQGAWAVRRHTKGVQEHSSWDQDAAGWTRCYYNRNPDLATACRSFNGVEDTDGSYVFPTAEEAFNAAKSLGVSVVVPARYASGRKTKLKAHKDRRLIVEFQHQDGDDSKGLEGWLVTKKKNWQRIYRTQVESLEEPDIASYDDTVRHIVTGNSEDAGWLLYDSGTWFNEPIAHIKLVLKAHGVINKDIDLILGSQVAKRWTLVNRPFEQEYPGNRLWNREAAQFRFPPTQDKEILVYPSWMKVLKHVGSGLDDAVLQNGWCKANGIGTGADYLKCWIAAAFQRPSEPVPYLFFYGPQNSGKSIFHEALSLLVTKGYQRADLALTSQGNFNGELENAVFCVVEETDLQKNAQAVNKIKDWVTSRQLNIRHLYRTPYHVNNTTHWIQCSNDHNACPVLPGDTRITMAYVKSIELTDMIPKRKLIPALEKEAPDFLAELLRLEIPDSPDRLFVPVIVTSEKAATEAMNMTTVARFVAENTFKVPGETIPFGDLYNRFLEWLEPSEVAHFTKMRFRRELSPSTPSGYYGGNNITCIGNLSWTDMKQTKTVLAMAGTRITHA